MGYLLHVAVLSSPPPPLSPTVRPHPDWNPNDRKDRNSDLSLVSEAEEEEEEDGLVELALAALATADERGEGGATSRLRNRKQT